MAQPLVREIIPLPERPGKPRETGITHTVDTGIGIDITRSIFEVAGEFIDNIRIVRAAFLICPDWWLDRKIRLCHEFGIDVELGGFGYEFALINDKVPEVFAAAKRQGFTSVEVSLNIVSESTEQIAEHIKIARDLGLIAYFEWGRKYPEGPMPVDEAEEYCSAALASGAAKVVIERSEVDTVLDDPEPLSRVSDLLGAENVVFEAGPNRPDYPARLISALGADVNLGNIAIEPSEATDGIMLVEHARRGLSRGVGHRFWVELAEQLQQSRVS